MTRNAVAGIGFAVLLTGCVTVSEQRFSLDSATGEIKREYRDLRSRQGADEKNYSVTNDWASLKKMVEDRDAEFDPEVVEDVSKSLFEDGGVLCGRKLQKVRCPKAFPSKAAILSYLHDKDWRFEMLNDDVLLVVPGGKKLTSTNGQRVTTPGNSLVFWPGDTNRFEYAVGEESSAGTSLLPFFRAEKKPAP
jgi:hypothetical protein